MMNKQQTIIFFWIIGLVLFVGTSSLKAQNIKCVGPFGGAGDIGDPGYWTLIGQPGNSDDLTGFGGVDYGYSYLDRFVRIDDYLVFLNDVDPFNTGNYEGALVDFGVIEYTGGLWKTRAWSECTPFSGQNMSASEVGEIAVSYISYNQAARFANWVNDGNVNTGAYTFASSDGNANVVSVNLNCDCIRLPTEDEFYKAAFYDPSTILIQITELLFWMARENL